MVLLREEILRKLTEEFVSQVSSGLGFRRFMPSLREGVRVSSALMPSIKDPGISSALPDFGASKMDVERFSILGLDKGQMSDVSIDLRVGKDIFVSDVLYHKISGIDHLNDLERRGKIERVESKGDGSFLLEPDVGGRKVYYVSSFERICLPSDLELVVDSRSTTGRVFAMCNDRSKGNLRAGEPSHIIVSVQPYAFPLIIRTGETSLFQAVVRYVNSNLMTPEEVMADSKSVALFEGNEELDLSLNGRFGKDGLVMRYDTALVLKAKLAEEIPGPIDMDVRGVYEVEDYFEIMKGDGEVELEAGRTYLMGTIERIRLGSVCGHLSRETEDSGTGMWGHFAGKIQPMFDGRITLECRSDVNRVICRGDAASFVEFDRMSRDLKAGEGYAVSGSYTNQKKVVPQPPKMFKPFTA